MNLEFEKVKVYYDGEKSTSMQGEVVIEPLERGFGATLGNALRRVMLSSMPGASAIGIKMPDIYHEFASIPHASTDMIELILNIKKIRFHSSSDELETVRFEAKKEGVYQAKDLVLPTGVEIKNPEQELIALTGEGTVEFELYVNQGRGYVNSESITDFKDRPDIIEIDGMFSPVRNISFTVEKMRLGQDATYERLIMNVMTDGSVTPKDAVDVARKILIAHLGAFENMSDVAEKMEIFKEKKEEENRKMNMTIEELNLSVRSYNCLNGAGYTTVGKIYNELTETSLRAIRNMGDRSVAEVVQKMKDLGLEMKKK